MPLLMHAVKFGHTRGEGPPAAHPAHEGSGAVETSPDSRTARSPLITCGCVQSAAEVVQASETMLASLIWLRLDRDAGVADVTQQHGQKVLPNYKSCRLDQPFSRNS